MNFLRKLIWVYLILLTVEGALRKWGIPSLQAPLLLIRDPLVFWIYIVAAMRGLSFTRNGFFIPNLALAVIASVTATIFGVANALVTVYGLRTDYLQVPLIFLLPQILNRDDVLLLGKFFLWSALPMTALVVLQFRSPPGSFWNKGAMATHYYTVRPSGTFSFSNGLAYFYSFSSAFVLYGYLHKRTYPIWLLGLVTFATLLAAGCSGSRGMILSIGLVVIAAVFCVVMRGKGMGGVLIAAALIAIAVSILSSLSVFHEATEQLQERFVDAGVNEQQQGGMLGRYFGTLFDAFDTAATVPFFGYGLGTGTNGAAALFSASSDLPWPESEWARLVFERGAILGLLQCAFRVALTYAIGMAAFRAYRRDNILPLLLFAAVGQLVLNGQWGGPTPLGFAHPRRGPDPGRVRGARGPVG